MRGGATTVYVIINGSFGVGKTSVARELRSLVPGATVFDPEKVGFVLQRLPGYRRSDFQHLRTWRRLTVLGARWIGALRPVVIIPMAFSEVSYLHEIRSRLASPGRPVLHFCLTAPLQVIRERLAARGEPEQDPRWSWVHRRAAECCAAHASSAFAPHVPTAGITPATIAATLAARVEGESGA
jgi:predicted kinase